MKKTMVTGLTLVAAGPTETDALEARARVGEGFRRRIEEMDSSPLFVELVAGHEGYSRGRMSDDGKGGSPRRKFWSRERVRELAARLGSGVPLYLCHAPAGAVRRKVGEVVSAGERRVNGLLSAVGLAAVTDPEVKRDIRSGRLDVCSIEAEIECHGEDGSSGAWIVDAVRKVTGVALGRSGHDRPGFAYASVLAAVEEFEEPGERQGGDGETDAPAETLPSELFGRERLMSDPVVADVIRKEAAKVEGLEQGLEAKNGKLRRAGRELSRLKKAARMARLSEKARVDAARMLEGTSLGRIEREIIIEDLVTRPPLKGAGFELELKERIESEMRKIDRLKSAWPVGRSAAPPERPRRWGAGRDNPLIPRPRGF